MDGLKHIIFGLLGRHSWTEIAEFGNVFLLLPAAAIIAAALAAGSRRREALAWSAAILSCAAITFALKKTFGDFDVVLFGHVFRASSFPSGHVALATAFYGGLALIAWRAGTAVSRALAAALVGMIGLIAVAVVVIGWHHLLDIVFGAAVGAVAVAAARRALAAAPRG